MVILDLTNKMITPLDLIITRHRQEFSDANRANPFVGTVIKVKKKNKNRNNIKIKRTSWKQGNETPILVFHTCGSIHWTPKNQSFNYIYLYVSIVYKFHLLNTYTF